MSDNRLVKILYNEEKRLGMITCWYDAIWIVIQSLGMTANEKRIRNMKKSMVKAS